MGSTVVLAFEAPQFTWLVEPGEKVKMGQPIGYIEYDEESGVFGWVMALMSLSPVYALRRLSHDSASLCALSAPPSSSIAISTPASCFWRWYDSLLPVFCSSPVPY
mgnify:CR=1 FL=1